MKILVVDEKCDVCGGSGKVNAEQCECIVEVERPRTRGECKNGERPCPWVGCRHHLMLELKRSDCCTVLKAPNVQLTHPGDDGLGDIEAMTETCALDVAERGRMTLENIGHMFGITRERVRQIEAKALRKIRCHPRYVLAAQALRRSLEDLNARDELRPATYFPRKTRGEIYGIPRAIPGKVQKRRAG